MSLSRVGRGYPPKVVRIGLVVLLVMALTACGSRSRYSHTRAEVDRAFEAQGFKLVVAGFPGFSGSGLDVVLRPRKRDSDSFFLVTVHKSDAEAAEAFEPYEQTGTKRTYQGRSGNVLVIADEPVSPAVRSRLDAVLTDLAD
jgi:hypothetical protein